MKAISIMYHDIVAPGASEASGFPGTRAARYKLDSADFHDHLRAIATVRRQPSITPDLVLSGTGPLPLLLTFDDGGKSAYTEVAQCLEEMGWRGHFLLTTNYIGMPSFLSVAEIRELRARGHIIGSHSSSHPTHMSRCVWQELRSEWETSVARLADILGERVTVASVPGGHYSRRIAQAASLAGLEMLFTSEPTIRCRVVDRCLVLGRYTVVRTTPPKEVAALATGRATPRLRQAVSWNVKKLIKTLTGDLYLKLTETLLGD